MNITNFHRKFVFKISRNHKISVFLSAVPVVAALMAIPILQEMPGLPAWIGMVTVTVGILLALGFTRK